MAPPGEQPAFDVGAQGVQQITDLHDTGREDKAGISTGVRGQGGERGADPGEAILHPPFPRRQIAPGVFFQFGAFGPRGHDNHRLAEIRSSNISCAALMISEAAE